MKYSFVHSALFDFNLFFCISLFFFNTFPIFILVLFFFIFVLLIWFLFIFDFSYIHPRPLFLHLRPPHLVPLHFRYFELSRRLIRLPSSLYCHPFLFSHILHSLWHHAHQSNHNQRQYSISVLSP
ncbi:hypothetical protein Tcan_01669 [Toxocara canis]|uniref:Uncharacterized protein n=1 Tax=Toxocara canis TaxID=6265 RepID=A0A0B2UZI4_TOXCA|nr:hypothetical protein Tcan_01669 [Toxocara canis]